MLHTLSRLVSTFIFVMALPSAYAGVFETGWLKDEKGAVDPNTKATVVVVAGMNGSEDRDGKMKWAGRHIGIEIPLAKLDSNKLVLIDESGTLIPHKHPEVHVDSLLKSGGKGIYVKLFVERPPGFKFKIRANQ